MTMSKRQEEFTKAVANLVLFATEQGYGLTFGDAWRSTDPLVCPSCKGSHSYQQLLVMNGKSQTSVSQHSKRLAVDFNVFLVGVLANSEHHRPLGVYWESLGGRWGGRFGVRPEDFDAQIGWDPGHFEFTEV